MREHLCLRVGSLSKCSFPCRRIAPFTGDDRNPILSFGAYLANQQPQPAIVASATGFRGALAVRVHRNRRPVFQQARFETAFEEIPVERRTGRADERLVRRGFAQSFADGQREFGIFVHAGLGLPEAGNVRLVPHLPQHAAALEMLRGGDGPGHECLPRVVGHRRQVVVVKGIAVIKDARIARILYSSSVFNKRS